MTSLVQFRLPKTVKHKEAKKLICELVRDMNEKGELAPFDVALLHRMSTAYEMYLVCVDKITQDGMTMKNKKGEINSCDIYYQPDLEEYNKQYLEYTTRTAKKCQDRDLSEDCMVIGTSAIIDTEIDGAVGMNSGIFNNPFMIWGRYKKKWFRYELPLSFQFHHTQMDGAHAGAFLANLQREIKEL